MTLAQTVDTTMSAADRALAELDQQKAAWPRVSVAERIAILSRIKDCTLPVARAWAETASRKKGIPAGSPLEGEEWLSGPYALLSYCNAMIDTLNAIAAGSHLQGVPMRELPNGQLAVEVVPHSGWDRLLLSGVRAEVWMQPGITRANLAAHTASAYDPALPHPGRLALVLGAGNIASIAPLDALHKLFSEHQVALVKMNPVNEYLTEFLEPALQPLIAMGVLRFIHGDAAVGQYLCTHPLVDEIHITGSGAVHDQIVWGPGEEGARNRLAGTPRNARRITSELGAVCPTIVVPGPWTEEDIAFQSEHVATQKLHNAGFNCIACQVLVLARDWPQKEAFVQQLKRTIAASTPRPLYYPGAERRLADYLKAVAADGMLPADTSHCVVAPFDSGNGTAETGEVFAPALGITELAGGDAEAWLAAAIDYANTHLHGTLGANVLIHPDTMRSIGRQRFDRLIAELRYGCIAVNGWSGLGFLLPQVPWGAFPGHRLEDVQSGIGFVHNTMLFDRPQRSVIEAPFKPWPRSLFARPFSMLPRPPWFVTNRHARELGPLLTQFQYRPGWGTLTRIFLSALGG